MIALPFLTIEQRYNVPATYAARWLQRAPSEPPALAWTIETASYRADHTLTPQGATACLLHIDVTAKSRALRLVRAPLGLVIHSRARRYARACEREWSEEAPLSDLKGSR